MASQQHPYLGTPRNGHTGHATDIPIPTSPVEQPGEAPVPPQRIASSRAEVDVVTHLKRTMQKLQETLNERQNQIAQLKAVINSSESTAAKSVAPSVVSNVATPAVAVSPLSPPTSPRSLAKPKDDTIELSIRKFLAVTTGDEQSLASDDDFLDILNSIDEKIKKRLDSDEAQLADMKAKIADKEREWQDQTSASVDDVHGLRTVAWSNWPWRNKMGPSSYKFDYFISYRVSSESALARELRLELELRGKKAFLDQEELKDGEDWRQGFVTGLKRSKVVILLISKGCIERMKRSSRDVDNVLLEWETALCAQDMGFCHVIPVFIGLGELDFKEYPKERANMTSKENANDMVCQQSAFTTLSQVQAIARRIDHPYPKEGCYDELIDAIVKEIDVFDGLHISKASRRAMLAYFELASIDAFTSEHKDPLKTWMSDSVHILHIPRKHFDKARAVLEHNNTWKHFTIGDMGSLEDLRAFLKIVMMKSPRSVDIQGRTLDDEEFKALFTFWVACKDMPSIALTECTIEDERDFGSFYSLVSSISGIEEIIFSGGDMYMDTFTTFVAEKLINAVKTSEKISSIRLSSLSFEEEAFEKLMKGLKDTAVSKLDLSGNILDSPAELIGEFLRNNTTLKDFTYSDNYLDDEQLLLIIDGLKNNTTIRSLKLHGANPDNVTCDGLISLFTTLKTTKLENFEMSFVDGTATFNQECSAAFADFISRTTSLKTLVYIGGICGDTEAIQTAATALANNKSLLSVDLSGAFLDCERFKILASALSQMDQLKSLNMSGNNVSDMNIEQWIQPLFSMKSLESLRLNNNRLLGNGCLKCIAKMIEKGTSIAHLYLNYNGFTDEGAYEFALALQKSKTIQSVEIEGVLSSSKTVHALIEAFKINNNLLLKFDNEEVLNDLVKYEYTLPILFHKNNAANIIQPSSTAASTVIKFNENISDTTATAQQKETNISTTIIETKSRILKASAQLSEKEKDIDYFKKILSAVQSIGAIFKRMSVTHNYLNFDPTWPIELKNEEPSIVLMDRIMDQDRVISDMDKAIIREIGLRLRAKKVNKTMVEWLSQSDDHEDKADEEDAAEVILDDIMDQLNEVDAEVADEAENGHEESKNEEVGDGEGHQESGEGGVSGEVEGGEDAENGDDDNENGDDDYYENDDEEEEEEDVEDDAYSFVYDESLDPENKMVTFTVRKSQYPTVKFVNLRKAAVENDSKTFPTLVIVFLSESIISGLSESEEKVWAAINAWDYMMRLADETFLVVLPIFVATNGEGGGIIGNMMTKLRHALYLVSSKGSETLKDNQVVQDASKTAAAGKTENAEKSVARAFDTINRLFKLQGLVVENLQQVKELVEKIVEDCRLQLCKQEAVRSPNMQLLKNSEYEEAVANGFTTGLFNLSDDITSKNITIVEAWLPQSVFTKFEGVLGFEKESTTTLTTIMETFAKCGALESIDLDAALFRDSNDGTDDALAILTKTLKKSRLISLKLHMNMIGGKAAPGLAKAVSQHPTLKELHLHGFALHFTKDIALGLMENKVLTKLTLRGGRYDVNNMLCPAAMNDEGVKALSDLLLKNKTLTHLSLQGNSLTTSHMEQIGAALARNTTLTSLDLSYCQLPDNTVERLTTFLLPNRSIANLDLRFNMFGCEAGKSIAALLEKSHSLKSLNLADERATAAAMEEGLAAIFKALASNRFLQELNLSGRVMNSESIAAFPKALEKNGSLHNIYINDCAIEAGDMLKIVTILSKARRFKTVDIGSNELDEQCFLQIAEWIKHDHVMQIFNGGLSTHREYISATASSAIISAVETSNTLVEFDIELPSIPESIQARLDRNVWIQCTENTREAWRYAIYHNDKDVKSHLRSLENFAAFFAKDMHFLILMACEFGDIEMLKADFETASVKVLDLPDPNDGMTPLGCAIRGGFIEVVRFLLYHGVSPTASIGYGQQIPAFFYAAGTYGRIDIAKLILEEASPNPDEAVDDVAGEFTRHGFTALHKAALNGYYEAVDAIIKCGGTPDLVDAFGSTALHVAARGQIQEEDVEGEEDGNDEDYVGEEEEGDGEGEGEDEGEGEGEEEQDGEEQTEGEEAVTESNEEIQEPTADQVDKSEATEDDTKPKVDHARVIEILINAGVPGGALDGKGRTPLQIAIEKKKQHLVNVLQKLTSELPATDHVE